MQNTTDAKLNTLTLHSFNTCGLSDKRKRRSIFQWLHNNHKGIVFLQETHTTAISEKYWMQDWKGEMYFSHGTCGSRGVAILIPKNLSVDVKQIITDENGRYIILDVTIDDNSFILVNIYAPTKDKLVEQKMFLSKIKTHLSNFIDCNIIIGGDFNTCLNPKLDKKGGITENTSEYGKEILELNEELNLIDIWRIVNPNSKRYTWRGITKVGQVHSRLDFWLTSMHMIYDLKTTDIKPSIKSDHSIISLSFELHNSIQKGRGFWKFNSNLLKDPEYIRMIKDMVNNCKTMYGNNFTNKALLWDFIKCELRGATISFSSYKAKERRKNEALLNNKLLQLEQNIDHAPNPSDEAIKEYVNVKKEIEELNDYKANGHLMRSKAKWIEDGEKCTKYIIQLENRNYKTKYIKTIHVDERVVNEQKEILYEQKQFYADLYTEKTRNGTCSDDCSLLANPQNKLCDKDKKICDNVITIEECSESIKNLPNNKSPGSDGYTTEFYKFFWQDIKSLVFESFLYSFEIGELSLEQRRAILTLLPKPNKDLQQLKNWRPFSLHDTDYKSLTEKLAKI